MTDTLARPGATIAPTAAQERGRGGAGLFVWSLLAVLVSLVVSLWSGFDSLVASRGDNDSLLRLVEVRDLLAGQAWYDPTQYRMGLEGGFPMHWSRLVDAPLALIIRLAEALGFATPAAETAALVIWPSLLFVVALSLLVRMAIRLYGQAAVLPALVVGGVTLHTMGTFSPGTIDHHNVQITLLLLTLAMLIEGATWTRGLVAGAATALMPGVGMETAPYVAVVTGFVSLLLLVEGPRAARLATGFGAGFGGSAVLIFLATVGPARWGLPACDAFSSVQMSLAVLGGFGLAVLAGVPAAIRTLPRRLGALLAIGAACAALLAMAFPQCLGDPYAMLDPRLRTYWLDAVAEAQSFRSVAVHDPLLLFSYYATPIAALVVTGVVLWRAPVTRQALILTGLLAAAFAVSLWQVRGAMFSLPLAALPLAGLVARCRQAAAARGGAQRQLGMVLAWLIAFGTSWSVAGTLAAMAIAPDLVEAPDATDKPVTSCQDAGSFTTLAGLPPGKVLASSNLGAPILRYTGHTVFAGPYHRNVAGNLAALEAFIGPPDAVEASLRRYGVVYVAFCPGNSESAFLADAAPGRLMDALSRGAVPAFLVPLQGNATETLQIYGLRQNGLQSYSSSRF